MNRRRKRETQAHRGETQGTRHTLNRGTRVQRGSSCASTLTRRLKGDGGGYTNKTDRAPRGNFDLGEVTLTSKFRDNLSNSPRLPEKPRACPHFTQAEVMYCLNRHKALEAKLVT